MTGRALASVVLLALGGALSLWLHQRSLGDASCDVCLRPMHQETYYSVHTTDGEVTELCCPRCGLRFQSERDDVARVEVADFRTRAILDAEDAYYVEGSDVHACVHDGTVQKDLSGTQYVLDWDRCLPSLVAFARREDAERFRSVRGGRIRMYEELLAEGFGP